MVKAKVLFAFFFLGPLLLAGQDLTEFLPFLKSGDFEGLREEIMASQTTLDSNTYRIWLAACAIRTSGFKEADSLMNLVNGALESPADQLFHLNDATIGLKDRQPERVEKAIAAGLHLPDHQTYSFRRELKWARSQLLVRQNMLEEAEGYITDAIGDTLDLESDPYLSIKTLGEGFRVAYFNSKYELANWRIDQAEKLLPYLHRAHPYHGVILNNYGVMRMKEGDFEEGLSAYLRALRYKQMLATDKLEPELSGAYLNVSNAYGKLEKVGLTQAYLDTVEIIEQEAANYDVLSNLYLNQAFYEPNPQRKEQYYHDVIEIGDQVSTPYAINVVKAYVNLGIVTRRARNFQEAENYYSLAIENLEELRNPPKDYAANLYYNLGILQSSLGDNEAAEEYLLKARDLLEELFDDSYFLLSDIYCALAAISRQAGDLTMAQKRYQAALQLATRNYGDEHPRTGMVHSYLAKFALSEGRLDEAIWHALKSDQILTDHVRSDYFEFALSNCEALSEAYRRKSDEDQALWFFRKYQQYAGWEVDSTGQLVHRLPNITRPIYRINALQKQLEWFPETIDSTSTDLLFALSLEVRERLFFEGAQLDFQSKLKPIYDLLVDHHAQRLKSTGDRSHQDQLLRLFESYKSVLVSEAGRRYTIAKTWGIPDSIMQEEKEIRFRYESLYQTPEPGQNFTTDTTRMARMSEFQLRKNRFLQQLQNEHPEYYRRRLDTQPADVKLIQGHCRDRALAYVSYYASDHAWYGLLITPDTIALVEADRDKVDRSIGFLINFLDPAVVDVSEEKWQQFTIEFRSHAFTLHEALFGSLRPYLGDTQALCFLPDGQLHRVPLELMLTDSTGSGFRDMPYLLRAYDVSYASSVSSHMGGIINRPSDQKYVGFAPQGFSDNFGETQRNRAFTGLIGNRDEVKSARELFQGLSFVGSEAHKSNFIEHAPDAEILHLAMHGEVRDSQSQHSALLFAPRAGDQAVLLKAHEISELDLNNQLVVLSACQTDYGKVSAGEGILGLRRSFHLAGSPNLISTLWAVNDLSARHLMTNFFQNLATGQALSSSLRSAKLDFLASESDLKTHPIHWAGFTLHGDGLVDFASPRPTDTIFLAIICFFLLAVLFAFLLKA